MHDVPIDESSVIGRLLRSLGPFGFIAIDQASVNLGDLLTPSMPGRIVRVTGNPSECIAVFASEQAETLGCIAGWISDEE